MSPALITIVGAFAASVLGTLSTLLILKGRVDGVLDWMKAQNERERSQDTRLDELSIRCITCHQRMTSDFIGQSEYRSTIGAIHRDIASINHKLDQM